MLPTLAGVEVVRTRHGPAVAWASIPRWFVEMWFAAKCIPHYDAASRDLRKAVDAVRAADPSRWEAFRRENTDRIGRGLHRLLAGERVCDICGGAIVDDDLVVRLGSGHLRVKHASCVRLRAAAERERHRAAREARVARWRGIERERDANEQKMEAVRAVRTKINICSVIRTHHAVLDGDPDRLTADFLLKMIKGDAAVVPEADRIRPADFCTRRDLAARGWTEAGVRRFLDEPEFGAVDSTFVPGKGRWLYPRTTVEEVERSDAYRAFMAGHAGRSAAAHKRAAARRQKADERGGARGG